jgi:DNA-binding NarL/FixJ family response regulator
MTLKSKTKIRILIVEDHILVRMGLVTAAKVEPDIVVVAEALDGREAVEQYRKYKPDVVIMDLRLPGMNGIEIMQALRQEFGPVRVLVLTSYGTEQDIHRAMQAGASGYLLKDMPLDCLAEAIRAVHAGKQYFPPEITNRLATQAAHSELTERELAVLELISEGKSNKEVGVALGIVEGTVKIHVTNLLAKLGVMDRTQAVTTAIKRGLLQMK